jgi:hypothetical protein
MGQKRLLEKQNDRKILIDAADGTKILGRLGVGVDGNITLKWIFRSLKLKSLWHWVRDRDSMIGIATCYG